jgi:hypothetical protein
MLRIRKLRRLEAVKNLEVGLVRIGRALTQAAQYQHINLYVFLEIKHSLFLYFYRPM